MSGKKIGYIRVTTFNEQADKGVKVALKKFKKKLIKPTMINPYIPATPGSTFSSFLLKKNL